MEKQAHNPVIIARVTKSIIVLFMCVALVFMSSYKKPVKAEAAMTAVTVTGVIAVAAALTALGIGVAAQMGHPEYEQACQNIWNNITTDVKNQITLTGLAINEGMATLALTPAFLKSVYQQAKTYWTQAPSGSEITGSFTVQQFQNVTTIPIQISNYVYNGLNLGNLFNLKYSGKFVIPAVTAAGMTALLPVSNLTLKSETSYNSYKDLTGTSVSAYDFYLQGSTLVNTFCQHTRDELALWNNNYNFWSGYQMLVFPTTSTWITYSAKTDTGVNYLYYTDIDIGAGISYQFKVDGDAGTIPVFGPDLFNPADKDLFAEGDSVMTKSIDEVINDIEKRLEKDGYIPLTVPADSDIDDQRTRTQADTTGKDIATDADRTADDTYNDTNDKDTTQPKTSSMPNATIPQAITKKFPFSIPWDLYNSISNLVSVGKAPVFDIPVNLSSLNYHSNIHLDMVIFDPIALIFRWGLSLLFILALIILTGRVIKH